MSWVNVIFSMTASACLTLALVHGFIWWRQRAAWGSLLFAVAAVGTAALAAGDLAMMRAESPAHFAATLRWEHAAIWVVFVSLGAFVRLYLRAGRTWLLVSACALRTVALLLNFLLPASSLNYREITALRQVRFLGEWVSFGAGVANPWMLIGQASLALLLIFVADAARTVWRRGERRLALTVCGSIVFFVCAGTLQALLVFWAQAQWPLTPSLFYIGIVIAMAYQIGAEMLRAAQLSRDLREREEQIMLAAEAANLGFWLLDFAREEIWASDRWRSLFGFSAAERLPLDGVLQRLHPEDRDAARRTLAAVNEAGGRYHAEFRVSLPQGEVRWIASQGSVESASDGRPLCIRGVSMDVTRGKQSEYEAQAHRQEVARLLRVASLGELSNALAHELSQPMTAILGNAQAAQRFLGQHSCDLNEIRNILRDIVLDVQRTSDVIGRLRGLLTKGELIPEFLEANDLVLEAVDIMRHDLSARSVRVVTELAHDLPRIRGDRVQLRQVLINLILNAGEAMSQAGSSAHTLTLRSGRIETDHIRITVADTGCGIPPHCEERIFEPYHTTKPNGMGMGLSLSRSIVLAHGGRLWTERPVHSGATFHVSIPAWRGAAP